MMTQRELDAVAADMEAILVREPELGDFGFGLYRGRRTPEERATELAHQRELIREPLALAGFVKARAWLRQFDKIKSLNRRRSSYGLKHMAAHDIGYTTNGVFIAAAIAEGFQVVRIDYGPNAMLNISERALMIHHRAARRIVGKIAEGEDTKKRI